MPCIQFPSHLIDQFLSLYPFPDKKKNRGSEKKMYSQPKVTQLITGRVRKKAERYCITRTNKKDISNIQNPRFQAHGREKVDELEGLGMGSGWANVSIPSKGKRT